MTLHTTLNQTQNTLIKAELLCSCRHPKPKLLNNDWRCTNKDCMRPIGHAPPWRSPRAPIYACMGCGQPIQLDQAAWRAGTNAQPVLMCRACVVSDVGEDDTGGQP